MIEALALIHIRLAHKELVVKPGETVELPSDKAHKLLQMAAGKVRVSGSSSRQFALLGGAVVEWDSPLYGLLRGCLLKEMDTHVSVTHPLTGVVATIPKGWLIPSTDNHC